MAVKLGGWSALQLAVVAAVLVAVLAIAALWVSSSRKTMRDAVRLSEVKELQAAVELFFNEHDTYPVVTQAVSLGIPNTSCLGDNGFAASCVGGRAYLSPLPIRTVSTDFQYWYISRNAQGKSCVKAPCTSYAIQFTLEGRRATLAKGANCAQPSGIKSGVCQ